MTGTAIARLAPASSSDLIALADTARAFAEGARAENTRRAYSSDWADFTSWCTSAGLTALPAKPTTLALYLTAKAGDLAVSTLDRRLAAIRAAHRATDQAVPDNAALRQVISGIRRTLGRPPRKKRALITEDLRRVIAGLPADLAGVRDKALLLIGFAGALRRSELAAAAIDGPGAGVVRIVFVSEGLELHLDRSKGDQEGRGAVLGVGYGQTELCPVAALEAWLKAARIRSGPVFRPIDRWGHVGPGAITGASVALITKRACRRVGLNPRVFSGHSLRSGLITSAHAAGVSDPDIMRTSRHKKAETMHGYIQAAELFDGTASSRVGL